MNSNFDACYAFVLQSEGGYVNDPRDPGGMTNLGVTKRAWESYVGHEVTEADMRALTPDQVKPFYKENYWDKSAGDQLPLGVDYVVFDYAVNSGYMRANKMLQKCVGTVPDGSIGPMTLDKVLDANKSELVLDVCENRLRYLQSLSTYNTFGKGWKARVKLVEQRALNMV